MRGAFKALCTGLQALALLGLVAGCLATFTVLGMLLGAGLVIAVVGSLIWLLLQELWDRRKDHKPP